jgi:hypothetical protein
VSQTLTVVQTGLLRSLANNGSIWSAFLGKRRRTTDAIVNAGFARWDRDSYLCITRAGRAYLKLIDETVPYSGPAVRR